MTTSRLGELAYLTGRAASLGSRPAYLLICNHFFGNAVAAVFASVILVAAMLNAVAGVDSHRVYYARHFGDAEGSTARAYGRYIFSQLLVGFVGCCVCAGYFLFVEHSPWLALAAAAFVATERLADEVLRFTLFARARARWGWFMIVRVSAQMVLIGLVVLFRPSLEAGALFALAMLGGNLIAFGRSIPLGFLARTAMHPWLIRKQVRAAIRLILGSGLIWVLSLSTMFSGYLDRLIVLASAKTDLAIFSLIVASLSLVQTAVDYFYFSQHRREFLEGRISFIAAVSSRAYRIVIGGALAVGLTLTVINILLYRGAPHVPVVAIGFVALIQVTLGTSLIVREIAYWNNQLKAILRVELIFLAAIGAIFAALYLARLDYVWLLPPAAAALLLRLFLFAHIKHERIPIL